MCRRYPAKGGAAQQRRKFAAQRRISAGADSFRPEDGKGTGPRGPAARGNGMTDPFAVERYKELFIPMGWTLK